ncbi:hypothetical protein [Enhygromyxa salina]|uniref:hypothetical protein n=1 Tax=Enhygromyxa salina TaxID=215803 RepID=UPI000D022925|nr:hypothetical protein [Enhygromyxa salina]
MDDPELQRVTELLARERAGQLDDAEREELALYGEQPDLVERAHAHVPALILPGTSNDGAWLERVRADDALAQADHAPRMRAARGVGLGMMIGGWVIGMFGTPLGPALAVAGAVVVLGSFLRVRLGQRSDPYDEIKR